MESEPKISFEDTAVAFSYKTDGELKKAHFIFSLVNHPWVSSVATALVKVGLQLRLPIVGIIKKTVFFHFCGGESIDASQPVIGKLSKYNVQTILDYSVEGEDSEEAFERTAAEIIRTIEKAKDNSHMPFCVFKPTGIASSVLLEKIQNKESLSDADQHAFEKTKQRFDQICGTAYSYKIPVLVDAEETWIQEPIDALVMEMMNKYNQEKAIVFNTYQLYRTAALGNLRNHFHEAVMHNCYFGAKLVCGAYMEKERERAEKLGYESPIHPTKE
jgi:proline dehydrogenase